MSSQTIMWLFPIVYMLHDYEELIMGVPWLKRELHVLQQRFPAFARRYGSFSASSLGMAVALMLFFASVLTLITVEFQLYAFWCGLVTAYGLHAVFHIIQFVVYRKYVPCVLTSFPSVLYVAWALLVISGRYSVNGWDIVLWTAISLIVSLLYLVGVAHRSGARFQKWMEKHYDVQTIH